MKILAIIAALVCVLNVITFIDDVALMQFWGIVLIYPMMVLYILSRKKEK